MFKAMHDNDLSCEYVETLIAVIYDEATEVERRDFAAHSLNCVSCRNEISQLGAVKTVVNNWRTMEFDSLKSPLMNFAPAAVNRVKAVNAFSWREWLRGLFALPNGLSFNFQSLAAVVVLAVVASAIGYSLYQRIDRADQASVKEVPENKAPNQTSPRQSETLPPAPRTDEVAANTAAPPNLGVRKNSAPVKSALDGKVSSVKSGKHQTLRKITPEPVTPKMKIARPNPANPDLGFDEAAEYEDKAPRLSDLLDEIGSLKE